MGKTAFVFPGQGSQYIGMGTDLYEKSPAAKAVFDAADEALGFSFTELIFAGEAEELKRTVNAQPALLTMSIAVLAAMKEKNPNVDADVAYMAGHSLGEYTALAASGALDFKDAVRLARRRGELMQMAGDAHPGGMAAIIGLPDEAVETIAKNTGVAVANYNSPGQIIVSGSEEGIDAACEAAEEADCRMAIPLEVSGAFHSPLMEDAQEGLNEELATVPLQGPAVPIVGNTTATVLPSTPEAIRAELENQLCHSVRWTDSVRMMQELGVETFVEIGPGNVLTKLISRIAPEAETKTVGSWEDLETL